MTAQWRLPDHAVAAWMLIQCEIASCWGGQRSPHDEQRCIQDAMLTAAHTADPALMFMLRGEWAGVTLDSARLYFTRVRDGAEAIIKYAMAQRRLSTLVTHAASCAAHLLAPADEGTPRAAAFYAIYARGIRRLCDMALLTL